MGRLQFVAPERSDAHHALRTALVAQGHDEVAIRQLLWLINASPTLVGHARVFERLEQLFALTMFSAEKLTWAGAWAENIGAFALISECIASQRNQLATLPGLDQLNAPGRSPSSPPMIGLGAMRHGLATALWMRHSQDQGRESVIRADSPAGRYRQLQAHVLAAAMDCRHRASSLEFYEAYAGTEERPTAPLAAKIYGPALRELCQTEHLRMLPAFSETADTPEFADALETGIVEAIGAQGEDDRYPGCFWTIRRFFQRFVRMQGGWAPPQHRGGRRHRVVRKDFPNLHRLAPGFEIYAVANDETDDEAASPEAEGATVYCLDAEADQKGSLAVAAENEGECPEEMLTATFRQNSAQKEFLSYQHRQRSIDARAQVLAFGPDSLGSGDVRALWQRTEVALARIRSVERVQRNHWIEGSAALALRLSLLYGLALKVVHEIEIVWLTPDLTPDWYALDAPAVVLSADKSGDWTTAAVAGLYIPGLSPMYRTAFEESLDDLDRPYVPGFVLPDHLGLAPDLLRIAGAGPVAQIRLFSQHASTLIESARTLLKSMNRPRVTLGRIAKLAFIRTVAPTADLALGWLLTDKQSDQQQARLYYTRMPIPRLRHAHRRIARRIAREAECRFLEGSRIHIPELSPTASTGARFAIATDPLRCLVGRLTTFLADRNTTRDTPAERRGYHNAYLLYLILLQAFATSMRPKERPDQLFVRWLQLGRPMGGFSSNLSDKEGAAQDQARQTYVPPMLCAQFAHFAAHLEFLREDPTLFAEFPASYREFGPMLVFKDTASFGPISPAWVARALKWISGYPLSPNLNRAYLRSELIARRCPAQSIDAFLGHGKNGESPTNSCSTFSPERFIALIREDIVSILQGIGFRPLESRWIPFRTRRS